MKEDDSLKISSKKITKLIDLMAELVVAKSKINQVYKNYEIKEASESITMLSRISLELQNLIMDIRTVSAKNLFSNIDDVSNIYNKENLVNIIYSGEETELDRNMLKTISPHIVHIIKDIFNKSSKKEYLKISATSEGNNNIIKIVSSKKIVLNDDLKQIIKQIELIKCKIHFFDSEDESIVTLKLPVTLSIIQALLVKVENNYFGIPITNIETTQKITDGIIKKVQNKEVFLLRGNPIPLIRLRETFEFENKNYDNQNIVIIKQKNKKIGFVVDNLIGQEDIVIKPLGTLINDIKCFNGGAILGNGKIALIIDPSYFI